MLKITGVKRVGWGQVTGGWRKQWVMMIHTL